MYILHNNSIAIAITRLNYTKNKNTHTHSYILTLRSKSVHEWKKKKCLSISIWWKTCSFTAVFHSVCVRVYAFFLSLFSVLFRISFLFSILIPPQKKAIAHITHNAQRRMTEVERARERTRTSSTNCSINIVDFVAFST